MSIKSVIAIVACIILIFVDQATKYWAVSYLRPVHSMVVIEDILSFTFVQNTGAAFGILAGARTFFIVITIIFVIGFIVYYIKLPQGKIYALVKVAIILILGGAIGNFIDRLLRGYVVDFFHVTFINFPVFNMADIFLVCGTALFMILYIFFIDEENEDEEDKEAEE